MTVSAFASRRSGDRMQNILLSACFGLLLWIIQQLFGLSASIAKADEKLASVEIQAASAYRASDARRDVAEIDKRLVRLERARWGDDR